MLCFFFWGIQWKSWHTVCSDVYYRAILMLMRHVIWKQTYWRAMWAVFSGLLHGAHTREQQCECFLRDWQRLNGALPDVHFVRAEAQQRVQHQTGGQVIRLTQLPHTHSSAAVHRLPPSACCNHKTRDQTDATTTSIAAAASITGCVSQRSVNTAALA